MRGRQGGVAQREAATKALHEIYRRLRDPQIERVVVIAHSQGTIIASVVLAPSPA